MTDQPPSPLLEPTLAEVFAADPTTISDQDFQRMILKYRQERSTWAEQAAKPKAGKADKASAPAKTSVEKGSVTSLLDLGL